MMIRYKTVHNVFFLLVFLSHPAFSASNTKNAMQVDQQHVNIWNKFADNLFQYHKYLISSHGIYKKETTGGYAAMPDYYREVSYYDEKTDKLLSRIQWETDNPEQIHAIEVYVYDSNNNLKADYLAAYLPGFRNAPIQTLINIHYKNDELHSYRQFDASGARIYENCKGKFFGEPLMISLEEDDFVSPQKNTMELLASEQYLACFEHTPHVAASYYSPMDISDVPAAFRKQQERQNDIEARLIQVSSAIEKKPDAASLYIERGNIYFQLQDFDKAINDYDIAISLNNKLDEAWFGRGMARGRAGLVSQGIDDLTVYIERNPESSRAYTKRGVRYIWAGNMEMAKKDLQQAVLLDAQNAEAHDDLGVVYARQGKYQKAIEHFKRVVELDSGYLKGFHNMAMVYHLTGNKKSALEKVNEALLIKPDEKNSLLLKAEILRSMDMHQEAKNIIERAEFLPDGNWSERLSM